MKRIIIAISAIGLTAIGLQAAPATAAPSNACVVTSLAPTLVVMGLSPRSVKASVTTTGSCDPDWELSVGAPVYDSAWDDSPYLTFVPDDFAYTMDQTLDVEATAYDTSGRGVFLTKRNGLTIKKYTYWSYVNAWPENVKKGKALTIGGQPRVANWAQDSYDYGLTDGGMVDIQFNPAGPAGWSTVFKGAHIAEGGSMYATVTAKTTGSWRLHFRGNTKDAGSYSANDWIVVR